MADRADDHPGREPVTEVAAAGAELESGGEDTVRLETRAMSASFSGSSPVCRLRLPVSGSMTTTANMPHESRPLASAWPVACSARVGAVE